MVSKGKVAVAKRACGRAGSHAHWDEMREAATSELLAARNFHLYSVHAYNSV